MAGESIVSSFCLSFLSSSIKEATFFSSLPFKWNPVKKQILLYGPLRRSLARFIAVSVSLLPIVITCRLFYWIRFEYDGSDRSTTLGLASVFGWSSFSVYALICWHSQKNYREYLLFINTALNFFAAIPREFRVRASRNSKNGCEFYLKVYRVFIHFTVLSYCAGILIRRPERPTSMMSFFDQPKDQPFFWPVTTFNVSLVVFGGVVVQCFCAVNIIYICALDTSVARVRAAIEKDTMSQGTFRRFYRSAQILQRTYNELFGSWILPAQHNLVIAVVIIAVYGTVAMEGHRSTYFGACVYQLSNLSFLCIRMGTLHESSMGLLDMVKATGGWRSRGNWYQKFQKSCRPIVVTQGRLFHVDKTLILTVWDTILVNAVNLLVTY